MAELLELDNVSKDFGGLRAVNRVSLRVHEGEILGLIGPNGAGKTTLFNMITGVYRPSSGRVLLRGELLAGLNPTEVLEAMDLIRTLRDTGTTIIMVEHVVKAIFGISDRVVVMNAGEQIAEGAPAAVARDERVIDAYLGAAHA